MLEKISDLSYGGYSSQINKMIEIIIEMEYGDIPGPSHTTHAKQFSYVYW